MSLRRWICMRDPSTVLLFVHLAPVQPLKIQVATQCQIALIQTVHTEGCSHHSSPNHHFFFHLFCFILFLFLFAILVSAAPAKSCDIVCMGMLAKSEIFHSNLVHDIDNDRHTYLMRRSYSFNSETHSISSRLERGLGGGDESLVLCASCKSAKITFLASCVCRIHNNMKISSAPWRHESGACSMYEFIKYRWRSYSRMRVDFHLFCSMLFAPFSFFSPFRTRLKVAQQIRESVDKCTKRRLLLRLNSRKPK